MRLKEAKRQETIKTKEALVEGNDPFHLLHPDLSLDIMVNQGMPNGVVIGHHQGQDQDLLPVLSLQQSQDLLPVLNLHLDQDLLPVPNLHLDQDPRCARNLLPPPTRC